MLKIIINNAIASDADKMAYIMSGEGFPTSYTDVQSLLDYFSEEQEVMVELHSCGGDTVEGWAIYDALRASGRTIHTKVVGLCGSMATVIFLAAPKERRTIAKHASMLIHSPYFPNAGKVDRHNIASLQAILEEDHNKMLDVYVERTGASREDLEAQMNDGGWFDAERAVELGFAGSIAPETSAKVQVSKMKKKGLRAAVEAFMRTLAATSAEVFTTEDGLEVEIEVGEDGTISIGDKASPDGEYRINDTIITVKDGEVVDIQQAEPMTEETPKTEGEGTQESEETEEPKDDTEVEELKRQIEELKEENEELKKRLEEQSDIVAAVETAGGREWLSAQTSKQMTFSRTEAKRNKDANDPYAEILASKKAALINK
jgi:ATP-dependent Clp protease protease subunit